MRTPFERSKLLKCFADRRYLTLLDASRRYSTLLDATRRYSTLLDATRRYSTLLDATRRYSFLKLKSKMYAKYIFFAQYLKYQQQTAEMVLLQKNRKYVTGSPLQLWLSLM
jgi:hypothetical protein